LNLRFWRRPVTTSTVVASAWEPQSSVSNGSYQLEEASGKKQRLYLGEVNRRALWQELDQLYMNRAEVSSAVLAGAGYVVGGGILIEAAKQRKETKGDVVAAREICDQFSRDAHLETMIHEGSIWALLHGTVLTQKNWVGGRLASLRVFPWQDCVEPKERLKDTNEITKWRQVDRRTGVEVDDYDADEIVRVSLPPLDDDGFGTGIIMSLRGLLSLRASMDADSKDYLHKSALPKEILTAGSPEQPVGKEEQSNLYAKAKTWRPGEIFVANYPVNYKAGGVGDVESAIWPSMMKTTQDRCVDGVIVPPTSYLRSATEASARAMLIHVRIALTQPLQQLWKAKIESEVFTPLLEGEGFDDPTVVPSLTFMPPTDAELSERWKRIIMAKQAGVISLEEARAMLDVREVEESGGEPLNVTKEKKKDDELEGATGEGSREVP